MKFKVTEIIPKVFLFEFKNNYDMCMHFLRYQEFYESPSPKFRGKKFKLLDFMQWYSSTFGNGVFTYTKDWGGFNIPSSIIKTVRHLGIDDMNDYDVVMWNAWKKCAAQAKGDFYIIGVVKGNSQTINHELAHAKFYLDPEYKKIMTKLVKSLSPTIRKSFNTNLKKFGYTPKVYIDETQAYMATGFSFGEPEKWDKEIRLFQDVFNKFVKEDKK